MRRSVPVVLAGLMLMAAVPAEAGQRGGGGHRPPAGPCCGHPGGGSHNVNVNVNAAAQAHASASAYAASGINARGWSGHGAGGRFVGGGTVYVGGGGYGVVEGVQGGVVWRGPIEPVYLAGPSAPFGYVVEGFGRDYGRAVAPWEVSRTAVRRERRYEERHESRHESRYESRYEGWSEAEAYAYWEGRAEDAYRAGYEDGRDDCDCAPPRRAHGHEGYAYDPPPVTYRPYQPPAADPGYYGDLPPPGAVPPRAPHPTYGHPNQPGERG